MRGAFLFLGLIAIGCGGADETQLFDGGSTGNDGGGTNDVITPTEGGPNCDVSKCATIPQGFHPVRLAADANATCPSGWTTTDAVTNPVAASDACSCGCSVTAQPTCNSGNVYRSFDDSTTASCNVGGTTVTPSACAAIPGGGFYLNHQHYEVFATEPAGGTCQFDATLDPKKVTSTPARVCAPPDSCSGEICGGAICVAEQGDVACPSDFGQKTLIGKATATCGTCGNGTCEPSGAACTGTLAFFTDAQCTVGEQDFTADSVCHGNVATNVNFYTNYSYKGSLKTQATCKGPLPTATATAALDQAVTVCCK